MTYRTTNIRSLPAAGVRDHAIMFSASLIAADLARSFGLASEGMLDDNTLIRLFGGLLERAEANGIELEEALKMATPPVKKSAGSKKKRP